MASFRTMPGLSKLKASSLEYRAKVPADVAEAVRGRKLSITFPAAGNEPAVRTQITLGTHAKIALRTRDESVAVVRTALAIAQLETVYGAARRGPQTLTHRQRVALSGEVYRLYVEVYRDEPGEPSYWSCLKGLNRAVREGRITDAPALDPHRSNDVEIARDWFGVDLTAGINNKNASALPHPEALEMRFGMLATLVLNRHGIQLDAVSRAAFLIEVERATTDAALSLKRAAEGDYTPDPKADRFPPFEMAPASPLLALTQLFDAWAAETKPSPNTIMTWTGVFRQLRDFLGHDDARRLTEEDVIRWKDNLLVAGRKPKTVNDSHLTALRSVLAHAVRNKMLPSNPAAGVRAAAKAVAGEGALPYSDEEVARLLGCASRESNTYKRWLPLLAAATGARIGELSQLHAAHVAKVEGITCIRIEPTEDGGRLKNQASERVVPLHPAVIEAGFLDFVREHGPGPLFYKRSSGIETKRHASKGVANHLGSWIREQGFKDPRKAPAHALRHWFKSAAFKAGVADSLADHLQGHKTPSVAARYRHFDIETLAKAVAAIPIPKQPH